MLINDARVDPVVLFAKPLWLAAKNGHTEVAALFIFNNFNQRIYNRFKCIKFKENKTPQHPLLWAVEHGFTGIVQLYIEKDLNKDEEFSDQISIYQISYYSAIIHENK